MAVYNLSIREENKMIKNVNRIFMFLEVSVVCSLPTQNCLCFYLQFSYLFKSPQGARELCEHQRQIHKPTLDFGRACYTKHAKCMTLFCRLT